MFLNPIQQLISMGPQSTAFLCLGQAATVAITSSLSDVLKRGTQVIQEDLANLRGDFVVVIHLYLRLLCLGFPCQAVQDVDL